MTSPADAIREVAALLRALPDGAANALDRSVVRLHSPVEDHGEAVCAACRLRSPWPCDTAAAAVERMDTRRRRLAP